MTQATLALGEIDSAIEFGKKVIELDPNFPRGHEELGLAYLGKKLYPEALREFQTATELSGRARRSLSGLGFALAITGKREEAQSVLKELQGKYEKHSACAQDIAAVYTGLGERDQAFAWLEKGVQDRSGQLGRIRWEQPFVSLQDDPRFKSILEMGVISK